MTEDDIVQGRVDSLRERFALVSGLGDLREDSRHPSHLSDDALAELQRMVSTSMQYVGEPATDLEVDAMVISGLLRMWSLDLNTRTIEGMLA